MRSRLEHPVFLAVLGVAGLLIGSYGRTGTEASPLLPKAPGEAPPRASGGAKGDARPGHAGKREPGAATSPSALPPRGWWGVLKGVASRFSSDRVMTEAAGVTFYTLLAIFPGLAALISIYGLLADPRTIADHLGALGGIMPGGGVDIIREQVQSLTSGGRGGLGLGALFGIATSLWSANQGTKALFEALNVVNEETESRGFLRRTAVTLAFTVGALGFVVLALGAIVVVPVVLGFLGLDDLAAALLRYARWPLLLVAVGVLLALIYRFGPSLEDATWRLLSWGSGFAAVSWLIGSAAFSWYVANFGSYNETYGSLGAAVGFMTWIWISVIIILVGGELNVELERRLDRGGPGGGKPGPAARRRP